MNEIPCVDKVDNTQGTYKWSDKAKEALKKMNSYCNLTAGLEAVLQVAVGAQVMLRRNIDVSRGLVNAVVGTVIAIKAHHITVEFDSRPEPHNVQRVRNALATSFAIPISTVANTQSLRIKICARIALRTH